MNTLTKDDFYPVWQMILTVARTAQLISLEDVQRVQNTISMSHALGPMIDPTKYRDVGMDNLEEQQVLIDGFAAFRKAIEKVKELGAERAS